MTVVKSVYDLNQELVANLHNIKQLNFDCVVGIPRSGMIPASLIATHLQLPLADVYGFLNGNLNLKSGKFKSANVAHNLKILLVDDTINTGKAMKSAVQLIQSKFSTVEIVRFAVWKSEKTNHNDFDFVCSICNNPRAFQWNIWNHNSSINWATDFDGVLCRNPTKEENDKGLKLENFYKTVHPLFVYQKPIKYIVTARLEKYRKITEIWLKSNNIKYESLIMKSDTSKEHWEYKKDFLKDHNEISLYIESDVKQAKMISKNCSTSVWCVDNQTFYQK